METAVARRAWQLVEPLHAITYFAPELRASTDALGLRGGWMSYFGCRAAPMGPVPASVVTAVFYNFSPAMVARAIPDAWSYATPVQLLEARLSAMDAALARLLGDALAGEDVRSAAALAADAAAVAATVGRPLAAANAELPLPAEPHLALWQALTVLREHRGDGHVTALVAAEVGPIAAHVLAAAAGRAPAELIRTARKWSEQDWAGTTADLADRGWVSADGTLTDAGRTARRAVEQTTDRLALQPYAALGAERVTALFDALYRLDTIVMAHGGVPSPNPIGVPWPPTDEIT
jgi:Helix-turn-helix family